MHKNHEDPKELSSFKEVCTNDNEIGNDFTDPLP